jgi:hypothetical protein
MRGGDENAYKILVRKLEGRVDLEDLSVGRRIMTREMCEGVSDHNIIVVRSLYLRENLPFPFDLLFLSCLFNDAVTIETKYSEKTCPNATWFATNFT